MGGRPRARAAAVAVAALVASASAQFDPLPPPPLFTVTGVSPADACEVTEGGNCITTGDGSYTNDERCTFSVTASAVLRPRLFDTEPCCDYLEVNGTRYYGNNITQAPTTPPPPSPPGPPEQYSDDEGYYSGGGPTGFPDYLHVEAGTNVTWYTDASVTRAGFTVCGTRGTPAPTIDPNTLFAVTSSTPAGSCDVISNGTCFSDGDGAYGNLELCTITVLRGSVIAATEFDTEACCDALVVSTTGRAHSGTSFPTQYVPAGTVITWRSDASITAAGFTICGVAGTTPSPTTAAPTPAGTVVFDSASGNPCTIAASGQCFTDGPGPYGVNERCTVRARIATSLFVYSFSTQEGADVLTVGGMAYSGSVGPSGVSVAANTTISWSSDATASAHRGFYICSSALAAPTMPMVLPTNRGNVSDMEAGRVWCNSGPIVNSTRDAGSLRGVAGSEHAYAFVARNNEPVTLTTCGSSFDTQLIVTSYPGRGTGAATVAQQQNATVVANVDDVFPAACGLNRLLAQVTVTLPPGVYQVIVRGSGLASGAYRLAAQCTSEQRGEVTPGVPVIGNTQTGRNVLGQPSREHWYTLLVEQEADYVFDLCNSSFDTYLRLLDFELTEIASLDDGGCSGGLQSRIQRRLPRGEYVVLVEGFSGIEGAYQLRVDVAQRGILSTQRFQGDAACDLALGGSLSHDATEHVYSFAAAIDGTYRFDACSTASARGGGGVGNDFNLAVFSGVVGLAGGPITLPLVSATDSANSSTWRVCPGGLRVVRPYIEVDLTAGNYTLLMNATGVSFGTYSVAVKCPRQYVGLAPCDQSVMINPTTNITVDTYQEYYVFENGQGYVGYPGSSINTRFGVNLTQTFGFSALHSYDVLVSPCSNPRAPLAECCNGSVRLTGAPQYAGSVLGVGPDSKWHPLCSNGVGRNLTFGLVPGQWLLEFTGWQEYNYQYACDGGGSAPPLITCNGSAVVEVSSPAPEVVVRHFRAAADGAHSVTVCGSAVHGAVVHGASLGGVPWCTGAACCTTGISLRLSDADVVFIEVNSSATANLSVSCPSMGQWKLMATTAGYDSLAGLIYKLNDDNRWLTICEDGSDWTSADAFVACRMLGFAGGLPSSVARSGLAYTASTNNEFIGNTSCVGTESSLDECGDSTLGGPGQCVNTLPTARCMRSNLGLSARRLECGRRIATEAASSPQLFGLSSGDSVAYFRLTEPKTVVLSTCGSDNATDLYLWSLPTNSTANVTAAWRVTPALGSLLHKCISGVCSVTNDACGSRASLGGDAVPLQLPAGEYLTIAEFQSGTTGLLSVSLTCSAPLTSSSLRIDGADESASSARGNVEVWNATSWMWEQLRDPRWTKQDAQVVCRQLGFDFGDNPDPATRVYRDLSRECNGNETQFDACLEPVVPPGGPFEPAFASCSDKNQISVIRNEVRASNYWGLASPQFVGQTYNSQPVNLSAFENAVGSIRFDLEVLDGDSLGQFLVEQRSGEILSRPLRRGVVNLVLSATDDLGFTTAVYVREVTVLERTFGVNPSSGWDPSVLALPDNVTINGTTTHNGPVRYGFNNDRLFVNHNLSSNSVVRFDVDYIARRDPVSRRRRQASGAAGLLPGRTFVDTVNGDFSLTAQLLGSYDAQIKALSNDGSSVVLRNWTFAVLNPDPLNASFGPGGRGCDNGGVAEDLVPLDGAFTCRCDALLWTGPNCDVTVTAAPTPGVLAQASSSSTSDDTTTWVYVGIAGFVVLALLMYLIVSHRRRTLDARHRRRVLRYIKTLARLERHSHRITYERAVHHARAKVLKAVAEFSPHVVEYHTKPADRGMRRMWSPGAHVSVPSDESHAAELNGAIFLALELGRQDLVVPLLREGTDGSLRHPTTSKMAVSQLLSDSGVPTIRYSVLVELLRAGRLEFDDTMGDLLKRRARFVRLVEDNDSTPIAMPRESNALDDTGFSVGAAGTGAGHNSRTQSASPDKAWGNASSQPEARDRVGSQASPRDRVASQGTSAKLGSATFSEYAYREGEGYVTVNQAVRTCLRGMAEDGWRTSDERSDTVVHCILTACQLNRLSESVAMELIEAVLEVQPSLLLQENGKGQSPSKIALQCVGCPVIESTFTIVVYRHYQLVTPGRPKYKSGTALIHEVRDLRLTEEDEAEERLAIKLMRDEDSWVRELQLRASSAASAQDVIAVKSAATLSGDIDFDCGDLPVEFCPGLDDEVRLQSTAELLKSFPYALVMPMADRNLAEVIQSERLAEESLDVIRQVGFRIGSAIHGLHSIGVVHADIKPRNIVRDGANDFKLIDLDMSFKWGRPNRKHGSTSSLPPMAAYLPETDDDADNDGPKHFDLAAREKIRSSTAYSCPELIRYLVVPPSPHDPTDGRQAVEDALTTAFRVDLWSFGVTLYEVATGLALFEHQYDRVTAAGEDALLRWGGLTDAHIEAIEKQFGRKESAALVDVLKWLLDPIAVHRPADMSGVLAHLFFNPKHGTMREHAAVDNIRALLENRKSGERPCKKVMISYCWADSAFVLNQLAPELAPLVEDLWLDRLGGDNGMGEWTGESMERGVSGSDVILSVVSPDYATSKNCGFEMGLVHRFKKPLIPLMFGIPFSEWPPERIGETEMQDQFRNPQTGDMKLFVDFTDIENFSLKFNTELLPRIRKADGSGKQNVRPPVAIGPENDDDIVVMPQMFELDSPEPPVMEVDEKGVQPAKGAPRGAHGAVTSPSSNTFLI